MVQLCIFTPESGDSPVDVYCTTHTASHLSLSNLNHSSRPTTPGVVIQRVKYGPLLSLSKRAFLRQSPTPQGDTLSPGLTCATSSLPLCPKKMSINLVNSIEPIKFECTLSYDHFNVRTLEKYDSQTITPPGKSSPKFFIRMKPKEQSGYSHYVRLYFNLVNSPKPVRVKINTSILDAKGLKHQPSLFEKDLTQGESNIYTTDRSGISGFLNGDTLNFLCEFNIYMEQNMDQISLAVEPSIQELTEQEKLALDLDKMFQNETRSDVVISVIGEKFNVHKNILSARSPVFAAMFEHETKEQQESQVNITDIEPDIFKLLLEYIYSAKIPSFDQLATARDLLAAADKYQLESLKLICEESLCSQLSVKNVQQLLIFADTHSASKLKDQALKLFKKNTQKVLDSVFANNEAGTLLEAFRVLHIKSNDKKEAEKTE